MWQIFARLCEHIVASPPHPSEASPQPNLHGARPENVVANPKEVPESWDPQESGTFFRFSTYCFLVLRTCLQSESTCFVQILTHRSSQHLDGKCRDIFACHFGGFRSGILQIWKKCQTIEILGILKLFSDLQYSTSKCSELACKLIQPVSSRHLYTVSHNSTRPENVKKLCMPIPTT